MEKSVNEKALKMVEKAVRAKKAKAQMMKAILDITLENKLGPVEQTSAVSWCAVRTLDIVGQFLKMNKERRKEYVRKVLEAVIDLYYDKEADEDEDIEENKAD